MNTMTSSEIFFIISSVGFVTLWILVIVFLFYLIRAMYVFLRIVSKIEKGVDKIGDTGQDLLLEVQDSAIFQFIFGKKRKGRKQAKN